ncbi:MAG: hypothetical protein OXC31_26550 [Spirochaetaceae bacterium]|nr:hypothetical protein [Spirochaetaceae bacterium]
MTPEALQELALAGISLPARAEVIGARADGSGDLVDVDVLDAQLARTGEVLADVPAPPLWLGRGGRGVYAPPAQGSRVLIEFVDGDRAAPIVTAALGDPEPQRPPKEVPIGAWALLDGRGGELWQDGDGTVRMLDAGGAMVRVAGDRVAIASSVRSLLSVAQRLVDVISALQTIGSPAQHAVSPANQAQLAEVRAQLAEVLA